MTVATATTTQVHVFVNRRKVPLDTADTTGAALLAAAGFEGQSWDLFQLQGEGDPTGGTLIQADQPLHVKDGDHFRAIPGNRSFGAR